MTKQEQVQKAIEDIAAEAGRLDMLFNNAGIGSTLPFETATLENWKKMVDTNLWSVIYGVHAAVPIMLKQGSGYIVNTSSLSGLIPFPMQALYSVTKFGVRALSECLRYEYAEKGFHFSAICLGDIATPIFKKSIDSKVTDELPIHADAIPADKAASYILDRVAEHKGIIIVPEEPNTDLWRGYVPGFKLHGEIFLNTAHARRAALEKSGSIY